MTGMAVNVNMADRVVKSVPVRRNRGLFDGALIMEGLPVRTGPDQSGIAAVRPGVCSVPDDESI